jgi:hypothetical protein
MEVNMMRTGLILILILILTIPGVVAESGPITVEDLTQKNYISGEGVSNVGLNMSKIYFYNSGYTHFNDLRMNTTGMAFQQLHFVNDFESTTGTITYGGSGSVIGYYDKNISALYLICVSTCRITGDYFLVNYTKNIWANVTSHPTFYWMGAAVAPDISSPVKIGSNTLAQPYIGYNYRANVASSTTDTYNVSYLVNNYFTVEVIKGKAITDKWFFNYSTGSYGYQSTFDKVDQFPTFIYSAGLYFKVCIESGTCTTKTINTTSLTPSPSPYYGNISTSKLIYNNSETMNIYFNSSTAGRILIQGNTGWITSRIIDTVAGYNQFVTYTFDPSFDPLGNYTLYLQYLNSSSDWITLNSTNITVIAPAGNIQFWSSEYFQENNAELYFYATETGNVTVYDSDGTIKYYRPVAAGDLNKRTDINFFIRSSDPVGTWTAKLYNSSGIVDQDTITVIFNGPTPTITSTTGTPSPQATIDYVGDPTARKSQENSFLNSAYGVMTGLFGMAVMATMIFFLKQMKL